MHIVFYSCEYKMINKRGDDVLTIKGTKIKRKDKHVPFSIDEYLNLIENNEDAFRSRDAKRKKRRKHNKE